MKLKWAAGGETGVGIAPRLLPSIFDLFTQAPRTLDRSQGGLGIGLSLVQKLVELHGGKVAAHSAGLGQGSEFVVRLPALSAAGAPIDPIGTAQRSEQTSRVLVVDDNVMRLICRLMLQMFGHEVTALPPVSRFGTASVLPRFCFVDIGLRYERLELRTPRQLTDTEWKIDRHSGRRTPMPTL